MLLRRIDPHAVRVKNRRQLARVGEADANRRAGQPRQQAAAQQALKIDHEVKLPLPQFLDE